MVKIKTLSLALASAVILSGCSLFPAQNKSVNDQTKQTEKLAKILEKGGQAVCEISRVNSEEKYTITYKGKNMKVSGIAMGKTGGFMIYDTLYTYIWEEGSKEGIKNKVTTAPNDYQPEAVAREYDDETKYNINCKEGGVSDSEFVPPTDVKFIDPAALMPSIPSSSNLPSIPNIPNIPSIPDSE